jgi:hypothetical protein
MHPAAASVGSDTPDQDLASNTVAWDLRVEPPPAISFADYSYLITSDRPSFFDVPVLLSSRAALEIAATIAVSNGTAIAGTDFQLSRPTLTIAPGRTEGSVRINLPPQPQPMAERTFTLGLTNVVNARLLRDHAVIRLRDTRVPTVTVSGGSQLEGAPSAPASIPFTVSLSSTLPEAVRVQYQTVNTTARAGIDYRPAQGTLIFPPGITNLTVAIDLFGNERWEADRRFHLVLGSVSNGRLGVTEAAGLIIDDDRGDTPTALIHYLSLEEGVVRIGYTVPAGLSVVLEAASEWITPAVWKAVSEPRLSDGNLTEVSNTPEDHVTQRFYRLRVTPWSE